MPSRVSHWLHCSRKDCCSYSRIFVTGSDVVRIARSLSLEPWRFTVPIRAPDDADDGFILDASGARFRLALARRAAAGSPNGGTCAFLLPLAGGARCGLGPLRPDACRLFPLHVEDEAIGIEPTGCTCDWADEAPDGDAPAALESSRKARAQYAGLVARWNAFVRSQPEAVSLEARDFARFLLDAYGT